MEKSLTYEEWKESLDLGNLPLRGAFDKARQGTIPAENAVVIPDVKDWPEGAEAIYVGFYDKTVLVKKIAHIPRPKPVWVPQVGEAVFFCTTDLTGQVARVIGFEIDHPNCWSVINADGNTILPSKEHVKPFHPDHIGKPWSEIPGEPS